ncbi:MAG: hypothetical protein GXP42_08790 [Chloroflexi bacterium]|nr:hypothetical protein [Chloroflexota bacterium]
MMNVELLDALLASIDKQEPVALVTVTRSRKPEQVGRRCLIWLDRPRLGRLGLSRQQETWVEHAARDALRKGEHRLLRDEENALELFVEVQQRPPTLVIVGAGHIAAPLCEIATLCEFSVTVIDDRPLFANRERFPKAARVIAADIRQTVRELAMDENTYVVLVTRGHSLDVECLLEIIDRPLAYIGMIGSARRVRAVFELLHREQGMPREKLARVYAPIGLPIEAETPAEIAVAIMAEIINVRRGGQAISLAELGRKSHL